MYRLWQILDRANTGPFCEVEDFNKKIFMPKLKEVIKKYAINMIQTIRYPTTMTLPIGFGRRPASYSLKSACSMSTLIVVSLSKNRNLRKPSTMHQGAI